MLFPPDNWLLINSGWPANGARHGFQLLKMLGHSMVPGMLSNETQNAKRTETNTQAGRKQQKSVYTKGLCVYTPHPQAPPETAPIYAEKVRESRPMPKKACVEISTPSDPATTYADLCQKRHG